MVGMRSMGFPCSAKSPLAVAADLLEHDARSGLFGMPELVGYRPDAIEAGHIDAHAVISALEG